MKINKKIPENEYLLRWVYDTASKKSMGNTRTNSRNSARIIPKRKYIHENVRRIGRVKIGLKDTVIMAIQKKGSTRIGIQQALSHNFSFSGITGTIKFLLWGDRISKAVLIQVQPDPQAPTGYNFVQK
jgi:branched-chain amino acid transport system substrate-binding protein